MVCDACADTLLLIDHEWNAARPPDDVLNGFRASPLACPLVYREFLRCSRGRTLFRRRGARIRRSIRITTQLARAHVFSGDKLEPLCRTPCEIEALPGTYALRFSLASYQDESRQLLLGATATDLETALRPVRGSVISAAASPATRKVNGTFVPNQAPVEILLIPGLIPNRHRFA